MIAFIEQRSSARHAVTKEITANIAVRLPPFYEELTVTGKLINLSYTGIKIKLCSPLPPRIDNSEIKIVITMPQSGLPITIQGIIRHHNEQTEYGVQFSGFQDELAVDDLMFECFKQGKHSQNSSA